MDVHSFKELIKPIVDAVAGRFVEPALGDMLNEDFPPTGETFKAIERACHEAIAAG